MADIWTTRLQDLMTAEQVLAHFVDAEVTKLNIFELAVDLKAKQMNYVLSPWVLALAARYVSIYGIEKGEEITRRVISFYIREHQTLH
ncbi:MAG: hypothetical protein A3F18_07920 [Legionellales bacterium RIFCSPHIGHO2_12_FULL_37_14]|nr:MAG: hypothetical protein A3F18_07920 [Legionellales bacterium RIFCSPHIGHO2_12_FULL_37_14]